MSNKSMRLLQSLYDSAETGLSLAEQFGEQAKRLDTMIDKIELGFVDSDQAVKELSEINADIKRAVIQLANNSNKAGCDILAETKNGRG